MKNCYFAMLLLLSAAFAAGCADDKEEAVSYTHLTLPTIYSV